MASGYVTSKGAPAQIGRELGRGGEGSVFEVPALPGQVAKIYHKPQDQKKQDKLRFMAESADQQLLLWSRFDIQGFCGALGTKRTRLPKARRSRCF